MSVHRCFTEKKPGFDVEAGILMNELIGFLGVRGLESVRILNRYDVEGIDEAVYNDAKFTVFSKLQTDEIFDECLPSMGGDARVLAVEAVPGQYDQRADACAQCLQLMTRGEFPKVKTAKLFVFKGDIADADMERIRSYLINPLESREAADDKPQRLTTEYPIPAPVKTIAGFITADEDKLREHSSHFNLAMDMADLLFLQAYFRDNEKRDPTVAELRVIDTYWSDHCRHTTFFTHLDDISIEDPDVKAAYDLYIQTRQEVYGDSAANRPQTLMDIATIAAKSLRSRGKLANIDISEEVNACSIHIDAKIDGKTEDWLLMFKNETHNHPTEVEPFGGAATCVGGAIRDPLSGRAYVYQAMRVTGAADPRASIENTIPGKIPQRKLTLTAARGNSSYGNQIGLAAGHVHEIYHPGFAAKRMELGAVVGAVKAENVARETPRPGDKVILLGGRTGRDGIGGATGSSKVQTGKSLVTFASEVQKGNAQQERNIQRLFLDPDVTKMIKKCNDFGAGGVSVAVGELADGLDIDLSLVRLKYEGLDGTEIALSESQERMAIVTAPENVDRLINKAEQENLEAYVVAEVTKAPRMVMRHEGKVIVDLSREFLSTNGATKNASVQVLTSQTSTINSHHSSLSSMVRDLRFCSQRGLYEMFDGTAGASSVLMKNGGMTQDTPTQAMAALLPVQGNAETTTCSVMAFGFDPYLSSENPFLAAKTAVVTSVAKLVATGCDPALAYLTFQEYFERLRDEPVRWGKPFSALLGAFEAQMGLGLAAIGGKDSMSGSFNDLDVPPTLVSFAIAPNDATHVITPEFKKPGHDVVIFNAEKTLPGTMDTWKNIRSLIEEKTILSAWAITEGGAIEGIFKMAIGNNIGFEASAALDPEILFAYTPGAIVAEAVRNIPGTLAVGRTIADPKIKIDGDEFTLDELRTSWAYELENIFPTKSSVPLNDASIASMANGNINKEQTVLAHQQPSPTNSPSSASISQLSYDARPAVLANERFSNPRVLVFNFPGTTGELDAARAVSRAGGIPRVVSIRNLTDKALDESISEAAQAIKESQILILPGGISFGDEPDGAAKFITAFFRIAKITDAVHEHIKTRAGLILGIGNGLQALANLGLVPFGEIVPAQDPLLLLSGPASALGGEEPPTEANHVKIRACDRPTFTINAIGRHQATYVHTRIASVNSPWMNLCEVGDIHAVAISHGEGRFTASEEMLAHLIAQGQIATQYTDIHGNPCMDAPINPNGSLMAVEGLFSPDGRVFGKMGHIERHGEHVAKNIYGNKHQPIIESGIAFFK